MGCENVANELEGDKIEIKIGSLMDLDKWVFVAGGALRNNLSFTRDFLNSHQPSQYFSDIAFH